MPQLEFFFDFTSPYTYLAAELLVKDPKYAGVEITWTPILLGGLFKSVGNRAPAEVPAKGVYMLNDLNRLSKHWNIDFNFPPDFPVLTLLALRGSMGLKQHGSPKFQEYNMAMFRAYWVHGRNLSNPVVWAQIVTEIGLDSDALKALAELDQVKEAVKASTNRAAEIGLFGVPSFLVNNELYWGVDRLFLVDEALGLAKA
jgi:2-hydroxychromene-2-carboxylate isomerase